MASVGKGNILILMDNEQLKKLALLLRNKEEALMTQAVNSEHERSNYIRSVSNVYRQSVSLLNDSAEIRNKYALEGGVKADIALHTLEYVKLGLNFGMQIIRNCCLRESYLGEIREHYESVVSELAQLSKDDDVPSLEQLAEEMEIIKNAMREYCYNARSASSRAMSKKYSEQLKQENIQLKDLLNKHKSKLGYVGDFKNLAEKQKLEVYSSLINESGRANMSKLQKLWTKVKMVKGPPVMVFAASVVVWDIYTAEHHLEAAISNTVSVLRDIGSFAVSAVVDGAVTGMMASMELGAFVVSVAGFVSGALAGFLFAAGAGALIEFIRASGGSEPPPVTGLKFHTATMPDGMELARIISHH